MTEPRPPASRQATLRQALAAVLRQGDCTARELSQLVGLPEKAVYDHLAHLARSLPARGEALAMTSPECLQCGFSFKGRSRLTRPSRCPRCHATRMTEPVFQIR
ncbi:MAG: transcriptional regulator [Desulfuromonadales bacterium]|nr:transcriptional regulator [Desulfuromonadales bacterium]